MIGHIYERYFSELTQYMTAMTGSQSAAEDIVQEAFLRALANANVLNDLCDEKCRAWLYKTARNLYFDRLRRLSRAPDEDMGDETLDDLTQVYVGQFIARLPDTERALFVLRYFSGYNSTELAKMFGLPPSTVRARLKSARDRIRKLYFED